MKHDEQKPVDIDFSNYFGGDDPKIQEFIHKTLNTVDGMKAHFEYQSQTLPEQLNIKVRYALMALFCHNKKEMSEEELNDYITFFSGTIALTQLAVLAELHSRITSYARICKRIKEKAEKDGAKPDLAHIIYLKAQAQSMMSLSDFITKTYNSDVVSAQEGFGEGFMALAKRRGIWDEILGEQKDATGK